MKAEEADEVKEAEVAEGEEAESVGEKKSWRVSAGGARRGDGENEDGRSRG